VLTVTDLFCGAGGSSSGAIQIPGVRIRMAANHWKLAVETHNTNHPDADHDCADISQVDPRRYPATDILWVSPECTNHSQAKGKRRDERQPDLFGEVLPDEASERSRATMWDVCRFVEAMKLRGRPYRGFVVENVVDVRQWMFFDAWTIALRSAGYCLHFVHLNSMFAQGAGAPAPQSRDRWYCVGHQAGNRCPDLARWTSPPAWCPQCDKRVRAVQAWKVPSRPWGRYRQQYTYVCASPRCGREVFPGVLPAAVAIDWTLPAERIGDRAKPLAPKTLARVEAGLRRYARPITVQTGGSSRHDGSRTWPTDQPMTTQTCQPTKAVACPPFLTIHRGGPDELRTAPIDGPAPTLTASGNHLGTVVPPMLVPAGGTWNDSAQPVWEPFRTRTTRDTEALVVPVEGRDGLAARPASQPARTQTARLQDALVVPLRNNGVARPAATDPAPTVAAAGNHHALVMRNNTARGDEGYMSTPVTEPVRTITTAGHQSLIRWDNHLLVPYYGTRATAREVTEPIGTIKTVDTYSLVGPQIAVEDCTFRMLEPHEIQLAMAFDGGYVVLGNKRERVRQLGNAVTPPAARDLIAALVEAITGDTVEAAA
jgi:DNA (cytosine-5)-methyltransferase 1